MAETPNQIASEKVENYRSIVFIQDYIVKALEDRGIKLSDIDNELHRWYADEVHNPGIWDRLARAHQIDGEPTVGDRRTGNTLTDMPISDRINSALSKNDRVDLTNLNCLLSNFLIRLQISSDADSGWRSLGKVAFPYYAILDLYQAGKDRYTNAYTDLIDIYKNNDVTDDLIMNGHKVYSIIPTTYTMFVVVNSGFGNVLASNNAKVKRYFYSSLMENMFRLYGPEKVVNLELFRAFTNYSFRGLV